MTNFKLDEASRTVMTEVGALSGYTQSIIKEVFEYLTYSWAIKIVDNPDTYATLNIPYLGTLTLKYKDDHITEKGELSTEVDYSFSLNDSFKKLVGVLHDEGYSELVPLMQKKIEQAIAIASATD